MLESTAASYSGQVTQRNATSNEPSPSKFYLLMKIFDDILSPVARLPRERRYIIRADGLKLLQKKMAEQNLTASYLTIRKAKKALGIRTRRNGNYWSGKSYLIWTPPTHTPDQIRQLKELNRERRKKKLIEKRMSDEQNWIHSSRRENKHAEALRQFMVAHNCEIRANEYLSSFHQSKTLLQSIKRELHISSVRRDNVWWWVYPAPDVQQWLLEKLEKMCLFDSLVEEAAQRGWSREVLRVARLDLEGISDCYINGKRYWYDINKFGIEPMSEPDESAAHET